MEQEHQRAEEFPHAPAAGKILVIDFTGHVLAVMGDIGRGNLEGPVHVPESVFYIYRHAHGSFTNWVPVIFASCEARGKRHIRSFMQTSVIVCTHNRRASLRETLESLKQMPVASDLWELLVVDNNSTDGTREEIERFTERCGLNVRYLQEPRTGKSFALNTGVREAKGEIIAFTDDDVLVAPEWLAGLVETFQQYECMGVAGRCLAAWGRVVKPDWFITDGPYRLCTGIIPFLDLGNLAKQTTQAPFGMNMAFKRSAFERYGLFRTDLGPVGAKRGQCEDTEFGRRLMRGGEKIFYSPKAIIFHPVLQERLTKRYVLSYYFNMGRAQIREQLNSEQASQPAASQHQTSSGQKQ